MSVNITPTSGGFIISRRPCPECGEPPFGNEYYCCGHCQHATIWPDGTCTKCGVLATMFPGKVEEFHKMVPRPERQTACHICRVVDDQAVPAVRECNELHQPVCAKHAKGCDEDGHGSSPLEVL